MAIYFTSKVFEKYFCRESSNSFNGDYEIIKKIFLISKVSHFHTQMKPSTCENGKIH
jgi:hypothetical protein